MGTRQYREIEIVSPTHERILGFKDIVREVNEIIPRPEGEPGSDNGTRTDMPTLDGAAYTLRRYCTMNRIIFRAASAASSPDIALALYQRVGGASGVAAKKASVTGLTIAAAGEMTGIFAEGDVEFDDGLVYILYGRESVGGSYTVNTYNRAAQIHLLEQNVPAGTYPTSFTTAISASVGFPPASFDPVVDTVAPGTAKTALVCRLRKV